MDFGKAFSYVFEDEEWLKKIGLAGVIALIPIIGQFVIVGWGLEIVRRVIEDDPEPLPDFTEFGDFLVKGLLIFLVGFVFFLPPILLIACNLTLLPVFDPAGSGGETGFTIITICLVCLNLLYGIVASFFLPAAVGNYAAKGELSAAFKLRELFQLVKKNFGPYLLVVLGSWVAVLIASLGVIACVIGVLFTSAYSYAVTAHLIGQAYERDTGAVDMNEPIPDAG
jgi:hypothetical protein